MNSSELAACCIFSSNLNRWCRDADITVEALSEQTSIPLSTLKQWASWGIASQHDAHPQDLAAMCEHFDVPDLADLWATPQTMNVMREADPVAINRLLAGLGGDRCRLYQHLNQFSATMNWRRHLMNATRAVG